MTAFEDKRFFNHPGIDIKAISRAIINNLQKNENRQGGSTISMQVIRLAYKNDARNMFTKIKEGWLALRLETGYCKMDILSMYAAHAPFGSNVVGLEAAAWRYFGRSPEKLSWAEMATLAVLPNAPSLVHPGRNRLTLMNKRNRLLDKLAHSGKISEQDCELAKQEPLPTKPLPLPQLAPHLLQRFRKDAVYNKQSPRIQTTIHAPLQEQVNKIIRQHQKSLAGNGINNICALVLDVESGSALAYTGNIYEPENKELESDVDVIMAPRSPGSALKPFLYTAMLSDGQLMPDALVPDIPTDISGYTPRNFDLGYDGAVPAANALSRSLNIPAIYLLKKYKYQRFYEFLKKCGFSTLKKPADHYGLSLVLGGCEVTMWELAGAYASMARVLNHDEKNNGIIDANDFHSPVYYSTDNKENTKKEAPLVDATSIYFTFKAMQEVMRPGEEGLWELFTSSQRIAWKTGTSFGFRDGWAIAVTPAFVVAVWVGNTDGEGRPELIGIKTAAPAMFDIIRLLPNAGWFKKPVSRYSYVPVCKKSGFRSGIDCHESDTLFMPPLAGRSASCPYHKIIHLDANGQYQVNEQCAAPSSMVHKSWFILPATMEYYYKKKNHDYAMQPPFLPGCEMSEPNRQMELLYPKQHARIFIPVEIQGEKGRTIFSATHRNRNAKIFWSLDDQFVGSTENIHQLALSPAPGKHLLTLTDDLGAIITCRFEILDKER